MSTANMNIRPSKKYGVSPEEVGKKHYKVKGLNSL